MKYCCIYYDMLKETAPYKVITRLNTKSLFRDMTQWSFGRQSLLQSEVECDCLQNGSTGLLQRFCTYLANCRTPYSVSFINIVINKMRKRLIFQSLLKTWQSICVREF
jgi:hypothetical protein